CENFFERDALVRTAVGGGDPLAEMRLDLAHRVPHDISRQERLQRSLEHEEVTVDPRLAGLSELHGRTFLPRLSAAGSCPRSRATPSSCARGASCRASSAGNTCAHAALRLRPTPPRAGLRASAGRGSDRSSLR